VTYRHDDAQSITIAYKGVPLYGTTAGSTATVKLDATGTVTITYGAVAGNSFIAGVSHGGGGNQGSAADLSAIVGAIGTQGTGAVYEVFGKSHAFDLSGKTLVFSGDVAPAPNPMPNPPSETSLPLVDDDTRQITLPFAFPFYGQTYSTVFVNADGNLTFGSGDVSSADRNASRLLAGAPRIAALYSDLDPAKGGVVSWHADDAQTVTISWSGVPAWAGQVGNTVHVKLTAAGDVTVSIDAASGWPAIVGASPGGSKSGASGVSLPFGGSASLGNGAVYEAFDSSYDLVGKTITFTK
jgi:hypothetical protein